MKNFKTQLSGQIGESLVVSELGRRGILATAFSGNVPDIDILAYANENTCHLQVKAWRHGAVSFDAKRFLSIRFEDDLQFIDGPNAELDLDLIFVFVRIGEESGKDKFFVATQACVQKMIEGGYRSNLEKKNNRRPRNPKTTHTALSETDLKSFSNRWDLIEDRLRSA